MVTETKEFNGFNCVLSHDCKTKMLFIEYYKKGRLYFRSCMRNFKKPLVKRFIKDFDEGVARELINLNMENL